MNQIERLEGNGYTLRLWSDAMYEVSTSAIKSLLNLATQRLEIQLEIDAYYHHIIRNWRVRFSWCLEFSGRQNFEQNLDHSQIVCANPMFLERLAFDLGDHIRRLSTSENQTWIITRREERILVRVHQGAERIFFYASEVTQEFDFGGRKSLIIEASVPSQRVAIRGDGSIEFGGMLVQADLLELLGIGDNCHIRFSVNAHQLKYSDDSGDFRLQFFTSPGTARLASVERIGWMLEQGQIMLPPRGYFDQFLTVLEGRDPDGNAAREVFAAVTRPNATNAINAIGDVSCEYNAKSQYLRCTINPCGPCEGCQYYEKN